MRNLTNYTSLQSAQTSKQIQHRSNVFLSNCNIMSSLNVDTTLYENISSSQTTMKIAGSYATFTGYLVVENEIVKVLSGSYNGTYTNFTIQRSRYNTVASSHSSGVDVRDVIRLDKVTSWEFNDTCESTQNSLFSTVLSSGNIRIQDDTRNYDIDSSTKLYNIKRNKYVYIFNGTVTEQICDFIGYIYRPYTQDSFEYVIEFKDRLNLYWNEPIDINKTFSNVTIKYVLSQVFNMSENMIEYTNGTIESDYFLVDEISTNEFNTYSEFLQALCANMLVRMYFTETGKIRILSDVNIGNISSQKTLTSAYFTDLSGAGDDNKVIINKVKCDYYERKTLFNRNDFLNGSTLKYVNFQYSTSTYIAVVDSNGFVENTINIGTNNIKHVTMSPEYYLLLVDTSNGNEFYCKCTDINTNGNIKIIGGFDKDRKWVNLGKLSYLISQGYTGLRNFTLYYGATELPTVFALNKDNETDTDLRIPIKPQETVKYSCKFGSPTVDNQEFSGIIKEIEGIYDTTFTNSTLKYLRRYSQGDDGVPLYLQTNKIDISGSGEGQYTILNSFNNSNIELKIEKATNNEDDFNLYITNTLTGTYTTFTPTLTLSNTIQIDNIANFNTGDVLSLDESNYNVATRKELYLKLKNEKWLIKSKFVSNNGFHFIVVDKNYPIGTDNSQFVTNKHSYNSVILLNEFYIKGNPVMEHLQNIEDSDATSIEDYGKNEYTLDGRFLNVEDIEYAIDYLKNGFKNTDSNSKKRYIEFATPVNYDLQILDVITFSDRVRLNISSDKFIIISKSVNCVGTTDTRFKAITLNDYVVTGGGLDIESRISYLPVAIPTYNYLGNEGLSTEVSTNLDNEVLSLSSTKIGLITLLKINPNIYKAKVGTNVREGVVSFTVTNIAGNYNTYNILLLYSGKRCILKINTEYLLVEGTQVVTNATTSTIVKVIERDVFNTGQTEISIQQDIQFCQILSISSVDGIYMTNTTIGNVDGGKYFKFSNNNIEIKVDNGYIGSETTYFDITNEKLKIRSNNTSNIFQIGNSTDDSYFSYNGFNITLQGELNISGNKGQINFLDSNLIMNDIFGSYIGIDFYGMSIGRTFTGDVRNIIRNNIITCGNFYNGRNNITSLTLGNEQSGNYFTIHNLNSESIIRHISLTDSYMPIKIDGLKITDNRNISGLADGTISYHDNHFYGRINGNWVQLDNI